jgi:hypothetical protein
VLCATCRRARALRSQRSKRKYITVIRGAFPQLDAQFVGMTGLDLRALTGGSASESAVDAMFEVVFGDRLMREADPEGCAPSPRAEAFDTSVRDTPATWLASLFRWMGGPWMDVDVEEAIAQRSQRGVWNAAGTSRTMVNEGALPFSLSRVRLPITRAEVELATLEAAVTGGLNPRFYADPLEFVPEPVAAGPKQVVAQNKVKADDLKTPLFVCSK